MIRKTKIFTVVALCMCIVLMFAACTINKPEEKPSVVTVNFVDYDGTLLEIVTTKSGNAPVYVG